MRNASGKYENRAGETPDGISENANRHRNIGGGSLCVHFVVGQIFSTPVLSPNALAGCAHPLEEGQEQVRQRETASRTFRAKKKLDHFLEAALPGMYLPLYTMVTFTRVPYAQAARRARLQDRILWTALVFLVLIGIVVLAALLERSR